MIQIKGKVIHGDGFGRVLGFPTANLERRSFSRLKQKIKLGIWAGRAELLFKESGSKSYPAAVVIGPIDKTGLPKLEVHLLGLSRNLYGEYLSIYLGIYLRPFHKYKSQAQLKAQIQKDINQVKILWKKRKIQDR